MDSNEFKIMRLTLRLTLKDLADILKVTPNTVSRYQSGRVKMSAVVKSRLINYINENNINKEWRLIEDEFRED